MKKILAFLLTGLALQATAQTEHPCARSHRLAGLPQQKTTVLSPLEELYDVKWVKLDLRLNNRDNSLSGCVTTKAQATASLPSYCFELYSGLIVDSVRINGATLPAGSGTGTLLDLRTVALPAALPAGAFFTAEVWYHGNPLQTAASTSRGYNSRLSASGSAASFSISSFYHASSWWPCKQSLADKIDSADLWYTVPDSCKAGGNGLLSQVTALPGNQRRYEWKERSPIAFYLLSVAVAPYAERRSYVHYTDGSGDSTLLLHYYYDSLSTIPQYSAAADSVAYTIDYFSTLFGRYPFWKEKYGHCFVPAYGGAMEHQTMSTMSIAYGSLVAHELGHQWWGDLVTHGSYRDFWLTEGFATYCELLFTSHFSGTAAGKTYRAGVMTQAAAGTGTVIVSDTTDESRVFSSRLTYAKGAAVLHMLHQLAGSDSLFFAGLRSYRNQFAYKTASTTDLKNVFTSAYGRDLDTFFNQWIYGEGVPVFSGAWNTIGNTLLIRINQTTTVPGSVGLFATPLEILVRSTAGDTLVKVYSNTPTQYYAFTWNKPVSYCIVDPDYHVLKGASPYLSQDESLSLPGAGEAIAVAVHPNPAASAWTVSGIRAASTLRLSDLSGRVVWQKQEAAGSEAVPAASLPAGLYLLSIRNGKELPLQIRLQKQ